MEDKKDKPVKEIRLGSIKATIWKKQHESITYFTTKIVRNYTTKKLVGPDDLGWRETSSFSFNDLETVKIAIDLAQKWIKEQIV